LFLCCDIAFSDALGPIEARPPLAGKKARHFRSFGQIETGGTICFFTLKA